MDVWLFSAPEQLWALTRDQDGANLPADLGPWHMTRPVTLQGDSADEQQAIAFITEHGFCCFN